MAVADAAESGGGNMGRRLLGLLWQLGQASAATCSLEAGQRRLSAIVTVLSPWSGRAVFLCRAPARREQIPFSTRAQSGSPSAENAGRGASDEGHGRPSTGSEEQVSPASTSETAIEAMRRLTSVCLLGRPNVGKSTLYNRLVADSRAIVYNTPHGHVTRDYREGRGELFGAVFRVIDTSGIEPYAEEGSILYRTKLLTESVVKRSDIVLLMLDARQGITPVDSEAAAWLRRTIDASSVRAVLNKAETPNTEARARVLAVAGEAAGLGFGEPIAVSAATGEGIDELFHAISPALDACSSRAAACDPTSNHRGSEAAASVSGRAPGAVSGEDRVAAFRLMGRGPRVRLPAGWADEWKESERVKVAVVGLPNVGKSTLANALLGYERSLTGPEPGLTRDDVRDVVEHKGKAVELIDTAGWVEKAAYDRFDDAGGRVAGQGVRKAERSMEQSAVAVLVVDARHVADEGFALRKAELRMVQRVQDEGRAMVLAANKMDLLSPAERNSFAKKLSETLAVRAPAMAGTLVVGISALKGSGVRDIVPAVVAAYGRWNWRATTGQLNAWVTAVRARHSAGAMGSALGRIKYVLQTSARPPHFVVFLGGSESLRMEHERGLLRMISEHFELHGVPIRLSVRCKSARGAKRHRR